MEVKQTNFPKAISIETPQNEDAGRIRVGFGTKIADVETGAEVPFVRSVDVHIPYDGLICANVKVLVGHVQVPYAEAMYAYEIPAGLKNEIFECGGYFYKLVPISEIPASVGTVHYEDGVLLLEGPKPNNKEAEYDAAKKHL